MSYIDRLFLPGALAIWCALIFMLVALWGYAQLLRGDDTARRFARRAYSCFVLSIGAASALLFVCLLQHDFRIELVYSSSSLDLSWHLQMAAVWAGQKGSFLIWLLCGSILGLPLMSKAGREEAAVMGIYCLTLLGLLFVLVRESPFVMLQRTPADGMGLDPLLQESWMVAHPLLVLAGYAAAGIPFCFAAAALWRRRYDRWAALSFPWALGGFLAFGTAILTGGYWAYETAGRGGYWSWDPVENVALIPWMLSAALVHGLHAERRRGRFRRANLVLACLLYPTVLHGTFLTRSGILADISVHNFVEPGTSGWLIGLNVVVIAVSGYLLATRLRGISSSPSDDPLLSRGSILALAIFTLTVSAAVVAAGTSAPLLGAVSMNPGRVSPELYDRVALLTALVVSLLVAIAPSLSWQRRPAGLTRRRLLGPGLLALLAGSSAAALGARSPLHVLLVFSTTLAIAANAQRVIEMGLRGELKGAGGYLAHVGAAAMFLGILASSAYDQSTEVLLEQGTQKQVEDDTLTFTRVLPRQGRSKERMEVEVVAKDGSSYFAYPELALDDRTRQIKVRPHIRRSLLDDISISPIEMNPGAPPGQSRRLELARGQEGQLGDLAFRFLGFDLGGEDDAGHQVGQDAPMTVGAALEVRRGEHLERVTPRYRFSPDGSVETPPSPLPGGGTVSLFAIDATTGSVRLDFAGVEGAEDEGSPATLTVERTRRPLINLVWSGFCLVLAGGAVAAARRLQEARL
jgi:cytochrome c-type biogenesis protein CcmF